MSDYAVAAQRALSGAGYVLTVGPRDRGLVVQGRRDSDERPFFMAFGLTLDEALERACVQAGVAPPLARMVG